jgi:hypothetical protein
LIFEIMQEVLCVAACCFQVLFTAVTLWNVTVWLFSSAQTTSVRTISQVAAPTFSLRTEFKLC